LLTLQERVELARLLEIEIPLHLILYPQPGPQTQADESEADITGYGGSAGGGKTFDLLRAPTKHIDNPGFGAVIFRRTMKQVKDEGGIWDQSEDLYSLGSGKANLTERFWQFPSGATIQFAGLENENDKYDWQGTEICLLEFDELTHFTKSQFFYLITRNRSTCGIRPKVKVTMNPEPGWVKELFAPWVDRTFPNPAESGEVRYFIRGKADQIVWLPEKPERTPCNCLKEGCENCFPPEKSITFIRASVYDNRKLLETNPGYITNLMVQDEVDRRRLLDGDWDVKPPHLVLDAYDETRNDIGWFEIPADWPLRAVGMDFGGHNTAEVVLTEEPSTGKLIVIGEDWPGHDRSYSDIADEIRNLSGNRTPTRGAGGNRTTEQGWRQAFRKEGIPLDEPDPKHADPKLQYKTVNDLFRSGDLLIMGCPKLKAMITSFKRKQDKYGNVTDDFDDAPYHLLAALRYIVIKLRPPKDVKVFAVEFFGAKSA
jgi:hypothetical protein